MLLWMKLAESVINEAPIAETKEENGMANEIEDSASTASLRKRNRTFLMQS